MRYPRAAFPLALLLASAASAAPVSWVNIPGPINSRGLLGSANNVVINSPPLPSQGPWYYLTISGNLNKVAAATQARESCIEVTTPQGDKFVIKPFSTGAFTNTIAVPAGTKTTPAFWTFGSGPCSLRFFELYADNASGPDAAWTDLQITLHDGSGNDPFPYSMSIPTNAIDPDTRTQSNWIDQTFDDTDSFVFPHARIVNRVRVKGYGTAVGGWATNSTLSPLGVTRYDITAPRADGAGDVTWTVSPFEAYAPSSSGFDLWIDCPVPVRTGPAHPWTTRAYSQGGSGAPGATLASVWIGLQPQLGNAPGAGTLDIVRSTPWAPDAPVRTQTFNAAPGVVKWYTFVTAYDCTPATGYWLDIHTQIPAGSPITDHEMALFTQVGNRVAMDDDGGSEQRSMLTFGAAPSVRPAVAPVIGPEPRDGHDGPLPAGVHYLAVAQYDARFEESGFYATSAGNLSGPITVEIRTGLPPAPCGPADMGSQGGVAAPDWALDNNDFVVFINAFFAHAIEADHGIQGGEPGADGLFDNNDFVVFIDEFFAGCV